MTDKPLVLLGDGVKSPPFSTEARIEAGTALRRLQQGEALQMPLSRPMFQAVGPGCHELRITDDGKEWRIMYHVAEDAIVVLDVFQKTTQQTPDRILKLCRSRLAAYKRALRG